MDSGLVEDVYVQLCTVLSVLLAVCCAVEQANHRNHGWVQPPWGGSTTSPIILIRQSLRVCCWHETAHSNVCVWI